MDTATQERATRGFEPSTIHTDDTPIGAAEKVIGELTELSIGAAKENARLVAELLTFMGASARVVMHAVDRQQAVATDIGRHVRETLAGTSGLRESTRRA